jgi:hypothetical protein
LGKSGSQRGGREGSLGEGVSSSFLKVEVISLGWKVVRKTRLVDWRWEMHNRS